jgi:hypothetical protein
VANRPRILILDKPDHTLDGVLQRPDQWDVVRAEDLRRLVTLVEEGPFAACVVDPSIPGVREQFGRLLRAEQILEMLDIGVAVLDAEWRVLWPTVLFAADVSVSVRASHLWRHSAGRSSRRATHTRSTQASSGLPARFRLQTPNNRYIESNLSPLPGPEHAGKRYVLQCRDITPRVLQRQKLDALHAAVRA